MKRFLFGFALICGLIFSVNTEAAVKYFTLDGANGKLSAMIQTPDKENYPVVILMHGFNSSKNMPLLRDIADKLEENGIATVRFDFNGHGQSYGRFEDMTIPNEIEDASKVYEYVSHLPNVTSISLSGHSQGGVVASMLAGELGTDKIKSVVLLAPASILRDMAAHGDLFGVKYDTDYLPPYVDIPGCCRVGQDYVETAKNLPIYETAARYKGKVLIIHGMADDLVPYSYGVEYDKIYTNSELKLLPGLNHNFVGNEDTVAEETADFVKKNTDK